MGRSWMFAIFALFFASTSFGAAGVTYHGRLLRADASPVLEPVVQFKIQIRTAGPENCLLYGETHTRNMSTSNGVFAITINDGTASAVNTEPFSLDRVFQNRGPFNFAAGKCAIGNSYTPNPADGRLMIVEFNDGTFAGWEQLPAQAINHVPSAIEAMTVGGYGPGSMLRVHDGGGLPAAVPALTSSQHSALMDLVNGTSSVYRTSASSVAGADVTGNISGTSSGFTGSLAGDVTGTQGATSVVRLQGRSVDNAAPTGGQVLKWSSGNSRWEPSNETPELPAGGTANQVLGRNAAGSAMEYKTITAGTGVIIGHTANAITINATGAGESTAVANVGTAGEGIYRDMTGSTINLRKLNVANTHPLSITLDGANNEIDIGVNAELQGLGGLSANGFVRRTGAGTYSSVASMSYSNLNQAVFTNNTGLLVSDGTSFLNKDCLPNQILKWLSPTGWTCAADADAAETDPQVGTIMTNFLSKWDGSALVSSGIFDNGTNVGIGTTLPGSPLHVATSAGIATMVESSNTTYAALSVKNSSSNKTWTALTVGSTGGAFGAAGAFSIDESLGGARLTILPGGNTGIGTVAPERLLHVNGPMRVAPASLPGSPAAGDIAIDAGDSNKLKYYDGSGWQTGGGGGNYVSPAGLVGAFSMASCPTGWLHADGSAVSRTTYASLFTALGTMYGPGNGTTTFNLPDYRGQFLRGWANGSANDPNRTTRTNRGDGTTGDAVGTKQAQASNHLSYVSATGDVYTAFSGAGTIPASGTSAYVLSGYYDGGYTHATALNFANSGNESRPVNVGVIYCVSTALTPVSTVASTGSGTTNKIPVWTSSSALGDSPLTVSGGNVGVGTASPNATLQVNGTFHAPGTVVQVVTSTLSSDLGPGANNAFSADLATLSITPKFANSKLLISLSNAVLSLTDSGGDPHLGCSARLITGATTVARAGHYLQNTDLTHMLNITLEGTHSPGSVAPITFALQLHQRNTTTCNLIFTGDYAGPGLFKIMEVAQ